MQRRSQALQPASIAALALAASLNGLWNDFTYDDRHIVLANHYIRPLSRAWTLLVLPYWPIESGGDGYRPFTLISFAIQWAFGGGSPLFFHAVQITAYVVTCLVALRLARLALPNLYAWLAVALFAVHPVHVEAVANIVGQSEIWAGLLLMLATYVYVSRRRANMLSPAACSLVASLYLAACLFKEHAIVLPAILLAAELLLVESDRSFRERLLSHRPFFLSLVLVGECFVYFRSAVIGQGQGLGGFGMYVPFLGMKVGAADRILTMLGVVPQWLRLLLWPASLSSEYGPPAYPIAEGLAVWQLPGLAILIGVIGLAIVLRRRNPAFSFGIAWLVLTLLPSSNFIIPSGILFAERTLFAPSLGAMIAVAALLPDLARFVSTSPRRVGVLVAGGAVLGAGIAKSTIQAMTWRNNEALFFSSVRAEPMVYRAYYMVAATLMEKGEHRQGEAAYLKAMSLFPYDPFVPYNLGQEYFKAGRYSHAYEMYKRAFRILPEFQDVQSRMALALAAQGRLPEARSQALRAVRQGAPDVGTLHAIIVAANQDARARQAARLAAASHTAEPLVR